MKKVFTRSNVLWFIYISIFTIIALEIFGRIYLTKVLKKSSNPKFQFDSYRIYSHIPGFHEGDGKRDWIVMNNDGFRRTTDVSKAKPGNTFRAFLLGGSAAHGISTAAPYPIRHIYPDETIDAWLEKELKQNHPGKSIEIINAAVTGYQVFQHTSYLLAELLDYHPDLVIFFDGANDHYTNNPDYDYYGSNRYQFWKQRLRKSSLGGMTDYFMLWLSNYSGFARGYMAWRMNRDAEKNNGISDMYLNVTNDSLRIESHREAARKQFLRSIETNINILKSNRIHTIVCLQPMLVLRDTTLLSVDEKAFLHQDVNVQKLYPVVVNELKELTGKYEVPFIDINPSFNSIENNKRQLFFDYCHLSPLGGEVVSKAIFQAVDSLVDFNFRTKF
jgi:hypothetical protein